MEKLLKRLSIFFILLFVVVTLGYIYLDCDGVTPCDEAFLPQKTYQLFSTNSLISPAFTHIDPATSSILKNWSSVRAPPV
jgi:hypothetical protein